VGVRDFSWALVSGNGRYMALMDAGALGGVNYTTLARRIDAGQFQTVMWGRAAVRIAVPGLSLRHG
jgi:hypothetical protein